MDPNPSEAAFLAVFSNFDKCRREVAGDVISGAALVYVGVDVHANFGDSRLKSGRIIRLFDRSDPFTRFCAVFNTFCSRPETAGDVMSGVVDPTGVKVRVKFGASW